MTRPSQQHAPSPLVVACVTLSSPVCVCVTLRLFFGRHYTVTTEKLFSFFCDFFISGTFWYVSSLRMYTVWRRCKPCLKLRGGAASTARPRSARQCHTVIHIYIYTYMYDTITGETCGGGSHIAWNRSFCSVVRRLIGKEHSNSF